MPDATPKFLLGILNGEDPKDARIAELERQLRNAEYANKMVSDHRDELERQNAELRKDAARLRFMCERGARISHSLDGEVCNVWLPAERDGTEARPAEGYPQKSYGHWRDAIDAALQAGKEKA